MVLTAEYFWSAVDDIQSWRLPSRRLCCEDLRMWGLRSAAQAWFNRRIDTVIRTLCCVGRILAATGEQYKAAKPDEAVEDNIASL